MGTAIERIKEEEIIPAVGSAYGAPIYSEVQDDPEEHCPIPFYCKLNSTGYPLPIYVSTSSELFEELKLLNDNDLDHILLDLKEEKEPARWQLFKGQSFDEQFFRRDLYPLLLMKLDDLVDFINNYE